MLCIGVWTAVTAALALLTMADLVSAIHEANSHAVYASRDPGALIALAVLGLLVGMGALYSAVRAVRGHAGRFGPRRGLALTALTVLLILLYAFAALASGPL